jgi:hypothetical protein
LVADVGVVVTVEAEEEAVAVDSAGDVVLLVVGKDLVEELLQVAVALVEVDAALRHTGSMERQASMALDELMSC